MSTKKKIAKLEKLGVTNFESLSRTRRYQEDLRGRLQHTTIAPRTYEGLQGCSRGHCGRDDCCDACWFGWRRRRLSLIPLVHQLFSSATGEIHEVRVARAGWVQAHGRLHKISIKAVKKWNRWILDKLYEPEIMAVGMIKVAPAVAGYGDIWVGEVHELVANISKDDLERVLAGGRAPNQFQNQWEVTPVQNLGAAISSILRQDIGHWDAPGMDVATSWPSKALRRELYSWQLGLGVEERIIRYGCDGDFRKILKKARVANLKPRKPRPDPVWLEPYQFGSDTRETMDREKAARSRS